MNLGIGPAGQGYSPQPLRERFTPTPPAAPARESLVNAAPTRDRVELSATARIEATAAKRVEPVPATPPPEVVKEVDAAFERALELASHKRELHFFQDPDSSRIIVQVRDLEGNVIRTIPNEKALHVMGGAAL